MKLEIVLFSTLLRLAMASPPNREDHLFESKSGKTTKVAKIPKGDPMAKADKGSKSMKSSKSKKGSDGSSKSKTGSESSKMSSDASKSSSMDQADMSVASSSININRSANFFRLPGHLSKADNHCIGSPGYPLTYIFGPGNTGPVHCDEAGEQTGTDISVGHQGTFPSQFEPYTEPFYKSDMCPVNVHYHLGSEHRSEGQFDKASAEFNAGGSSPLCSEAPEDPLCFPDNITRCQLYDETDERFAQNYEWQHCIGAKVGETYEIHWPHSAFGDCGTVFQYQAPFVDGIFCNFPNPDGVFQPGVWPPVTVDGDAVPVPNLVGVQGQVVTIINDEDYYYPDLSRGMLIDASRDMGVEITKYTGSRTGSSFNSEDQCDPVFGVSWQVDRRCHLISASSLDKMCADMKTMPGMMRCGEPYCKPGFPQDEDGCCFPYTYPGGSREVVPDHLGADNENYRRLTFEY